MSGSFGKQKQKSGGTTEDYGSDVWGGQAPFLQELYRMGSSMAGGGGGYYAPQQQPMAPQAPVQAPVQQAAQQARLRPMGLVGGKNARDQQQYRQQRRGRPVAAPAPVAKNVPRQPAYVPQQPAYVPQQPAYVPQQPQRMMPVQSPADPWMQQAGRMIGQVDKTLTGMQAPTVDPAFQAYSQTLGQQFREQFLPELQGQAALAGGLGGSRQQIGSALGAQRAMQELGNFGANAYAGQQERALAAAQAQGQLADFARSMPWYGLQQYAGLLGSPTAISKGSKGTTKSKGSGFNAGLDFRS